MGGIYIAKVGALLVAALLLGAAVACNNGKSQPRDLAQLPSATPPEPTPTIASALQLDRFIYQASLTLREGGRSDANELSVSTRGVYVAPDRNSFTYSTKLGNGEAVRRLVMIGDDVWYQDGDAPWEKLDATNQKVVDLLAAAFTAVKPGFLGGPDFERVRANVLNLPSTQEFVNAVRTNHYQVGAEGRGLLEALQVGDEGLRSAADLTWDLWLAQDGLWPVRLQATGTVAVDLTVLRTLELKAPTEWTIRVDVEHPDDPDLAVEPPATS